MARTKRMNSATVVQFTTPKERQIEQNIDRCVAGKSLWGESKPHIKEHKISSQF